MRLKLKKIINLATFRQFLWEIQHSWWVALVILFCYLSFRQPLLKKELEICQLQSERNSYLQQQAELDEENRQLVLEISSQNDFDYIELTLKKVLGLVCEGEIKVFFEKNSE